MSVLIASALGAGFAATQPAPPLPQEQIHARVEALLAQMTLEEKIGQLNLIAPDKGDTVSPDERIRKGQVGAFLSVTDPQEINRMQHIALDQSRLKIPLLFAYDVIHGYRTLYPVPLAMASSWDLALVEHAQGMAARESSAGGIRWVFAPMVDIARDPRWGRIVEGAGEDPYLGAKIAAAQVSGLQGRYVGEPGRVAACVKHFAGYGAADGGRDYDSVDISEDRLWNVYLPPFRAAIHSGVASVMSAYMDFNGVPASGNRYLLQDVLRGTLGFTGLIVSDWETVKNLSTHGFASGPEDAAAKALNAGVDVDMASMSFQQSLERAVRDGLVPEENIDNAVRQILSLKLKLGLFENPYVDLEKAKVETGSQEQRQAARKAAQESAVLLRNDGLLPLSKTLPSIAVIGPLADSKRDTLGSWSMHGDLESTITVAEGIRRKLSGVRVQTTKGVEIDRVQPSIFDDVIPSPKPVLKTDREIAAEFEHAIDLVRSSDVSVLALGEAQNMSGERASRATLGLPGRQQQLLEAAVATGKPVVLVLLNGRPLDISWAAGHVRAILESWYPGSEGGNAIADLLFGDANPGGKLPITWPRSVGQVPIFYGQNLTQIPEAPDTRYWDESSAPLYPFGYGLSYSHFVIEGLKLSTHNMGQGEKLVASVDVHNDGSMEGAEIVQLYTHQRFGTASRPVRELKGFQRITLAPGAHRTVEFTLSVDDLKYWNSQSRQWVVDPADFDLWIGNDSRAALHDSFRVKP